MRTHRPAFSRTNLFVSCFSSLLSLSSLFRIRFSFLILLPRNAQLDTVLAQLNDAGSSSAHVKRRLSKAAFASPTSYWLLVYQSVVQSLFLLTIESFAPTPTELVLLDTLPFRTPEIFSVKSSYYHRTLQGSLILAQMSTCSSVLFVYMYINII